MKLYFHKTSGGAEYLMDTFIAWKHNGKSGKEGILKGAKYVVRIDGDITKDAELNGRACNSHNDLLEALKMCQVRLFLLDGISPQYEAASAAIAKATNG